jgi:hypothetical protein
MASHECPERIDREMIGFSMNGMSQHMAMEAPGNPWRVGTLALAMACMLGGCDQLGIETPAKSAERLLGEAKAIGSACRHAMRAIEDCYTLNPKADKSAMFAGWREMDEYMRENKIDGIAPVVPRPPPAASKPKKKASDADQEEEDAADTPASGASPAEPKAKSEH